MTGPRADGCHQLMDVGVDATLLMHKGKDRVAGRGVMSEVIERVSPLRCDVQ